MFARKNVVPKSQMPKKSKYVEHYVHSINKNERKWDQDYIQVVSIDPAVKNFAIRIERWNKNGNIEPIYFTRLDLLENEEDDDFNPAFIVLFNLLKELESKLVETHFFIIEKQLPHNYKVVRVSQHLITHIMFLTFNNKLLPIIYEVDPKLKGEVFNAGKLSETDLKKWAVTKAIEILTERKDQNSLDIIAGSRNSKKKKQDDLADTVIQTEALFRHILNSEVYDQFIYNQIKNIFDKIKENKELKDLNMKKIEEMKQIDLNVMKERSEIPKPKINVILNIK
jgi:hypothetical protein